MPTKKKRGRRAAAKTKAKAKKRTKAKTAAKKTRTKAKAGARKAKRIPARKRAPAKVAKRVSPKSAQTGPVVLDEVLEEPLLDASLILRVKDAAARSQRDVDEDELKQFPDPSLVVDIVTVNPQATEEPTGESELPDLFAAEARIQKQRAAEERAKPKRQDDSLFGSVGSGASDEDDEEREDG